MDPLGLVLKIICIPTSKTPPVGASLRVALDQVHLAPITSLEVGQEKKKKNSSRKVVTFKNDPKIFRPSHLTTTP